MQRGMTRAIRISALAAVAACVASWAPGAVADSNIYLLPRSPVNPTWEDCRILYSRYYSLLRKRHDQMSACLSQKAIFGEVTSCSGKPAMRAWSQCIGVELEICQISRQRDAEIERCHADARARLSREEAEDRERAEQIRKANDSYEKAKKLIGFLQDPKAYLRSIFAPYPNALDRIFGPSRDRLDADLGQEVYRYAHNQANAGVSATPNRLIRAIQTDALAHLGSVHGDVLRQLDEVSVQISNFDASLQAEFSSRPIASRPGSGTSGGGTTPDCLYNTEKLEQYLAQCAPQDGCAFRQQMEQIVQNSCH
jgi:hypothetical protein